MELPTLYKKTATGKIQEWTIRTQENIIITRWGQVGGALQNAEDVLQFGKNCGKKNETTAAQQAELEATSQWEKKLKKGYVKGLLSAQYDEVDDLIEGGVLPMLAHSYDKHSSKLKFPCHVQPKLDGHRCIAVVDGVGKCTLWTRTRKRITSMTHVVSAVEALGHCDIILDGELYAHAYRAKFEELTSFIRDKEARPGSEVLEYHVYDLFCPGPFEERLSDLRFLIPADDEGIVRSVATTEVVNEEELMQAFNMFMTAGYEGAMARNNDSLYQSGKRSSDLLKIKTMADAEFLVVGVEEGRGKLAGHAIFVCVTDEGGKKFRAKMMGTLESLKKYWEDPSLAVGKNLTVKYQGMTSGGVPRFPVAVRFA